jgi:uncharacterized protein
MFKRFLPTREQIKQSRFLRWLGPRIHDPSLWHINRRAVAKGVAIGAFFGLMIPVAQIPAAAVASLFVRANLWIAAVATLISNPFTYGPIYYFSYRLGSALLGGPAASNPDLAEAHVEQAVAALSWMSNAWHWITGIGRPLVLGMLVLAVTAAVVGYLAAQTFWRVKIIMKRRRQRSERALRIAPRVTAEP